MQEFPPCEFERGKEGQRKHLAIWSEKDERGRKGETKREKGDRDKTAGLRAPLGRSDSFCRISAQLTLSESDGREQREKTRLKADIPRGLRFATEGIDRPGDFTKIDYVMAVDIFLRAGYYRSETIIQMGDKSRALFIQNMRKGGGRKTWTVGNEISTRHIGNIPEK